MATQSISSQDAVDVDAIRQIVSKNFSTSVEHLKNLARIPSVAWDSFDPIHVRRSAEAVAELAKELGFDDVRIATAPKSDGAEGSPAVLARKPAAPGKPTILLYAHHDVQPPGDRELWDSEPFEPEQRGDRLYGRGAADDKAGVMAHWSAIRALEESTPDHGLGITLFIEGEEEAGSPSFRNFLETHREDLAADVIVVADSANWSVGTPSLTTSLRGMLGAEFEIRALDHAVHSGMFGGPILDAPILAARLVASLHDADGNVAVAGLEQRDTATVEYDEEQFRSDSSVVDGYRLAGSGKITDRLWNRPAISLIGLDVVSVANSANALIPQVRGKLSVRLAPGQDPVAAGEALRTHIEDLDLRGAEVRFTVTEAGSAYLQDAEHDAAARLMNESLQDAWGTDPVNTGIGGSIPFIADLKELYPSAHILITGVEDPDSRAHSANESLHLPEFEKAITAEALLLARLAAGGLGASSPE
ncbi:dipeptidase [Neomicrococcus aestuarii]|uniref:Dipeptidase n=1 Tax=Neomicrococcus aestuarii TaxID=556325 RepID=A0A1L2ZLM5_9MICC|nr:dipeptidase [Neomicrococcus aestuarii]APF40100.1 dipeptidase [Neomicrococcus aestuarii]